MEPFNRRRGFLMSAIAHLMIMMALASRPPATPVAPKPVPEAPRERRRAVFLPSPELLRELSPPRPRPLPQATPEPSPPPPTAERPKDRVSIGGPSEERAKGPVLLPRDVDLTASPRGRPNPAPTAIPPKAVAGAQGQEGAPAQSRTGDPGLQLPPGAERERAGEDRAQAPPRPTGPSIASSLKKLEQQWAESGPPGTVTGKGQQMGPLFFDPEGADFTAWINHFKNEVYRNWLVPQPALLGMRGHVDFEFTVERDGTLIDLRLLKSAGTPALDRAAQNALLGSRLLPLPHDFGPPRVTMQVSFFYNEGPPAS